MDTDEQFLSEWQQLVQERQRLIDEAEKLRRRLATFPQEPGIKNLLEEKQKLKIEAARLSGEIQFFKEENKDLAAGHFRLAKRRTRAATDPQWQEYLDVRLRERRERLAELEELGAPATIVTNETRMVFELEAPIEEVEKCFQEEFAETERKQQEKQCVFDEVLASIEGVEEHYRRTRHCLEDVLREAEECQRKHRIKQVEWATDSREHLEWVLEHAPTYKDDVVRRYRIRFPADSLADLFPPSPVAVHPERSGSKRRRIRFGFSTSVLVEREVFEIPMPEWRFWVTFSETDPGQELPSQREPFLACLQAVLEEAAYPELPVTKVYEQLMTVIGLEATRRQQIKKVKKLGDAEAQGWKIVRAGRKHRLFLLVDEEKRYIRFLPRRRRVSYSRH